MNRNRIAPSAVVWLVLGAVYFLIPLLATFLFSLKDAQTGKCCSLSAYGVILHDPQTAGMVSALKSAGALVIWRCHVGLDEPHHYAREAWDFLRGYVSDADAYVFSRQSFIW